MLYQKFSKAQKYGKNIMFVVGANRTEAFKEIEIAPDKYLVPGIGAQAEV